MSWIRNHPLLSFVQQLLLIIAIAGCDREQQPEASGNHQPKNEGALSSGAISFEPVPKPQMEAEEMYGLIVLGDLRFRNQVRSGLARLSEKAPDTLEFVQTHAAGIQEGRRTGVTFEVFPPWIKLSALTWARSDTWIAGALAHEAMHSSIYARKRRLGPVPRKVPAVEQQAEELECIRFEASILRKVGAPFGEIQSVERQNGLHFDTNRDGYFDWTDSLEPATQSTSGHGR